MGGTFYEPRLPKTIEGFHEDSREGTFIAEALALIASDIPQSDKAILQGAINLVKAKEYFSRGFPATAQEYLDQYPSLNPPQPRQFMGGALPPSRARMADRQNRSVNQICKSGRAVSSS